MNKLPIQNPFQHRKSANGQNPLQKHSLRFGQNWFDYQFMGRIPIINYIGSSNRRCFDKEYKGTQNYFNRTIPRVFKFEKVRLTFADDALRDCLQSGDRKAGARLNNTRNVVLDIMYEMLNKNLKIIIKKVLSWKDITTVYARTFAS